jgi:hypothetical protein
MPLAGIRTYSCGMSTERDPDATGVDSDFSVPEDADFTTPGDPIEDPEHLAEKAESEADDDEATPGNPIGRDV